ncbi:MAG TPA: fasciclin domain-containing protein [Euzebyales bacterium]|nr:fasciclin domain-containing protein [Euzebyales bacterium]
MKRSLLLLGLLAAALLLLAACSSAEETGGTATEGGGAADASEPTDDTIVSEPALDETSEPAADAEGETSGQSLADVAADNPQLTQLVQALEAAGLTSALQDAGPLTVFAPNNDAFASLDRSDLTELLANPQQLGDILRYHVVEGAVTSSDMEDGQTLTTLEGSDLTVSVDGSTISVDGAEVVEPDIEAGNGVIHIINGVIRPPSS